MGTISCAVQHGMKTKAQHECLTSKIREMRPKMRPRIRQLSSPPPATHTLLPTNTSSSPSGSPRGCACVWSRVAEGRSSDSLSSGGALPRHCCGAGGICTKRYRVASTCAFMGDTGRHATIQIFQSPYNYRQVKRVARVGTARRHSPHGHKNGLPGKG